MSCAFVKEEGCCLSSLKPAALSCMCSQSAPHNRIALGTDSNNEVVAWVCKLLGGLAPEDSLFFVVIHLLPHLVCVEENVLELTAARPIPDQRCIRLCFGCCPLHSLGLESGCNDVSQVLD